MIFSVFQKNLVLGYSWSTLLWHRCYYPHRSRDALSPVCKIFSKLFNGQLISPAFRIYLSFCQKTHQKAANVTFCQISPVGMVPWCFLGVTVHVTVHCTVSLAVIRGRSELNIFQQTRPKPGAALQTFIHPLVKISLRRRHAQTIKNGSSIHKTNYIGTFSAIPNLEGHLNRCIGSKVTAIQLNGWIFPTGGVASGRVCPAACAAGLFLKNLLSTNASKWICLHNFIFLGHLKSKSNVNLLDHKWVDFTQCWSQHGVGLLPTRLPHLVFTSPVVLNKLRCS